MRPVPAARKKPPGMPRSKQQSRASEKQDAPFYDGFLGLHSVPLQPHIGYQFLNP